MYIYIYARPFLCGGIAGQLSAFPGPKFLQYLSSSVRWGCSFFMAYLSSVDPSRLLHPAATPNLPLLCSSWTCVSLSFSLKPGFQLGKPLKSEGRTGPLDYSKLHILFSKSKILFLTAWDGSHSKHGSTTNKLTLGSCVQHMQKCGSCV